MLWHYGSGGAAHFMGLDEMADINEIALDNTSNNASSGVVLSDASTTADVGILEVNVSNKKRATASSRATKNSETREINVTMPRSDRSIHSVISPSSTQNVYVDKASIQNQQAARSSSTASVKAVLAAQSNICVFPSVVPITATSSLAANPPAPPKLILNEIAWMGSPPAAGETAAKASSREWIELKNISNAAVDVAGWQLLDKAGNIKIMLQSTSSALLAPGAFYLLVREGQSLPTAQANTNTDIPADLGYSGSLSNAGDQIALLDPNCTTADFLDASAGWPAGDAAMKRTLERDGDGIDWHTSTQPGGTPRAENSEPPHYNVSVSMTGNGTGVVTSTPAGISCGFTCQGSYLADTKLTFTAIPDTGSMFNGWSGACHGSSVQCTFIVTSSVALTADFEPIPPKISFSVPTDPDVASQTPATPVASSTPIATSTAPSSGDTQAGTTSSTATTPIGSASSTAAPVRIAEVQISGASSSNDYVKLFNATGAAVDMSGWRLHKKSSTGTDYSLKTFPTGATILPGGYFVWANSSGGFADSIDANVSSTETLAAENSAVLMDATGAIVDQASWGTGSNQMNFLLQ